MSVVIDGTSGITFPDSSSQSAAAESPSTTYGDVGTYGLFFWSGAGQRGPGSTVAGSSLYPCNGYGYLYAGYATGYGPPSGTWRMMGSTGYYNGTGAISRDDMYTCVFVRIS